MKRAIEIAKLGAGKVSPNPLVGAVVVHENKIIGEGYHEIYGEAHAEVNAIESVKDKDKLAESTIYVTLEPCAHHGKTPPCVDLILKSKIPHVVIGCLDPNPLVAGKSTERLLANNIKVDVKCLQKYAQSLNGCLGKKGQSVWLTNDLSKRWVHKLRNEVDAILVGKNTTLIDKPSLSTRYDFGVSARRVFLGASPENQLESDIVFDGHTPVSYFDLNGLLEVLHQQRIQSLIVEGGAKVLTSFIEKELWDEAYVFTAPVSIEKEGIQSPNLEGELIERYEFEEDTLMHYKR